MRGQIYSLIAAMMIVPLLVFMTLYMTNVETMKSGTNEKVVSDQEAHLARSIERDLERALLISGKRALLAATSHVVTVGEPLNNSEDVIEELMTQGTLLGNSSAMMIGNRLEDWRETITSLPTGFQKQVNYSGVSVSRNSLDVMVHMVLGMNISDNLGIAEIRKNIEKDALIPLEYLEDPLFALNTEGFVKRMVTEYPYPYYAKEVLSGSGEAGCSGEVTFDAGNPDSDMILVTTDSSGVSGFRGVVSDTGVPSVSCYITGAPDAVGVINQTIQYSDYSVLYLDNQTQGVWSIPLKGGLENKSYYPGRGPSFLSRLEGSLVPENNSIESFVYVPELIGEGIPVKENQSLVDYLYFSEQDYYGNTVRGMPDWFVIDSESASRYNLTELLG